MSMTIPYNQSYGTAYTPDESSKKLRNSFDLAHRVTAHHSCMFVLNDDGSFPDLFHYHVTSQNMRPSPNDYKDYSQSDMIQILSDQLLGLHVGSVDLHMQSALVPSASNPKIYGFTVYYNHWRDGRYGGYKLPDVTRVNVGIHQGNLFIAHKAEDFIFEIIIDISRIENNEDEFEPQKIVVNDSFYELIVGLAARKLSADDCPLHALIMGLPPCL